MAAIRAIIRVLTGGTDSDKTDEEAVSTLSTYDLTVLENAFFNDPDGGTSKKKQNKQTVLNPHSAWMFNPAGSIRMGWDVGLLAPLLFYLLLALPFRLCFANEPVCNTGIYWFEMFIEAAFIIDIPMNFRTGIQQDTGPDDEVTLVEYDRRVVAGTYLKFWFGLDVCSGIPFMIIDLIAGVCGEDAEGGGAQNLKALKLLRILRFAKLMRLLKIGKILSSLDRTLVDMIEDFFMNATTRMIIQLASLTLFCGFFGHLLACVWVFVGRTADAQNIDSWLAHDSCDSELECEFGPFTAEDTTGGPHVGKIYISAFYFTMVTLTSVGYGEITPKNNTERVFSIFMLLISAGIFGVFIAVLTQIIATTDMDSRKVAEELDEVQSFCLRRRFEGDLGRRIRRHFRNFYKMKSAIDEHKILGNLGSALREEVSRIIITGQMQNVQIFQTLGPILWPRLLPMLAPLHFETKEELCVQEEAVEEMLIVEHGNLRGLRNFGERFEKQYQQRRILPGDCINTLAALGVHSKSFETVTAESCGEMYALSLQNFETMFVSTVEKAMKTQMINNEKAKYIFRTEGDFGPICFSCYWRLEVTVIEGHNIIGTKRSVEPSSFAVIEVIERTTNRPLSKWFVERTEVAPHTSSPKWSVCSRRNSKGYETKEPPSVPSVSAAWTDLKKSFDEILLRIRIFDANAHKSPSFLGHVDLDPEAIEEKGSSMDGDWYPLISPPGASFAQQQAKVLIRVLAKSPKTQSNCTHTKPATGGYNGSKFGGERYEEEKRSRSLPRFANSGIEHHPKVRTVKNKGATVEPSGSAI